MENNAAYLAELRIENRILRSRVLAYRIGFYGSLIAVISLFIMVARLLP